MFFKSINKILIVLIIISLVLPFTVFAQVKAGGAEGFSLVPCGSGGKDPCKFSDIIILIIRLINFLLAASAIVAMYHVLLAGWGMMTSLGNPEKIMAAKTGLEKALVGFAIVLLSFAFINLLVTGIFQVKCLDNWWTNPKQLFKSDSCFVP